MKKFTVLNGLVAPLDRANVDTDAIIPKQFLKSIKRSGFGPNLFDEWRYLDHGEPGMDNSRRPLNPGFRAEPAALSGRADSAGAREFRLRLVARACALGAGGLRLPRRSSRPALPISFSTTASRTACCRSRWHAEQVDELFKAVAANAGLQAGRSIWSSRPSPRRMARCIKFEVEAFRKHCLLNGLDDIGLTLQHVDEIKAYEAKTPRGAAVAVCVN